MPLCFSLSSRQLPDRRRSQVLNKKRFVKEFGPAEFAAADAVSSKTKPAGYGDLHVLGRRGVKSSLCADVQTFAPLSKATSTTTSALGFRSPTSRYGAAVGWASPRACLTAPSQAKLFAPFSGADIIVASPLGLRTAEEGGGIGAMLSSVEVLVVDQADVLAMQNWAHVEAVWSSLNRRPDSTRDIDFWRVREWCLNGWGALYRQNIVLRQVWRVPWESGAERSELYL